MKKRLNPEVEEALRRAFRAALLLAGGMRGAERAVKQAIDGLGPDFTPEDLLVEAVRSAVQPPKWQDDMHPGLPQELRALALLSPRGRNCFVLRLLLGIDRDACSEILELSRDEVDEAIHQSLLDLNPAVESVGCRP